MFGLASQSLIPPRLPPQLPQPPLQRPTRARYTRVRRFLFFAFTSSPQGCKKLCINDLQVKDSPLFPSPVKAKKAQSFTRKTHYINKLRVKVKGEGRNCELAECAMRRGVSVRAYEAAEEETANGRNRKERASFPQKKGGRREKKGSFARKSTSFRSISSCSQKTKYFSRERFEHSKLNPYFCA